MVASNYLRATSRLSESIWFRRRRSFSLIIILIIISRGTIADTGKASSPPCRPAPAAPIPDPLI